MDKTIAKLYGGTLTARTGFSSLGPAYRDCCHEAERIEQALARRLDDEGQALAERYAESLHAASDFVSRRIFVDCFRMGALLPLDTLSGSDPE